MVVKLSDRLKHVHIGISTLVAGKQVWKEATMCGVEGRYAVEGRFKESRKEFLSILRRKARDEGGKQVQGYMEMIMSLEYAD
jgi:hypothetical protein